VKPHATTFVELVKEVPYKHWTEEYRDSLVGLWRRIQKDERPAILQALGIVDGDERPELADAVGIVVVLSVRLKVADIISAMGVDYLKNMVSDEAIEYLKAIEQPTSGTP
jgi:hypothetical protein